MKKILLFLLMGMMMVPSEVYSKYYRERPIRLHMPTRTPNLYDIGVYVDSDSGDLAITPNDAITGLNITITGDGVTYLNTTVSLGAGQSYTDCLDYLPVGTYILTLSTVDGVIDQYEITVEDDE
ncbi:MAG: hypothetical protein IK075_01695 [Prevotella sp.]|nr:hypothetical protein [Prevotella sp.]